MGAVGDPALPAEVAGPGVGVRCKLLEGIGPCNAVIAPGPHRRWTGFRFDAIERFGPDTWTTVHRSRGDGGVASTEHAQTQHTDSRLVR